MAAKKNPKYNVSKYGSRVERGGLVQVKHIIVKGNSKKDMGFHYIFKAVFYNYSNKWWPILTPSKELNGSFRP